MNTTTHPSGFERIDAKRIAGNSLALLVHAVAFALLMLPNSWEAPRQAPRTETVVVEYVPPVEIPPALPPPPIEPVQPRRPPTPVATLQSTSTPVADSPPVMNEGTVFAEPVDEGGALESFDVGPPGVETLAYDVHPAPRYPRLALRAGLEGRVTLRVLVDEQGWPRTVEIERSSGHRELDRTAREHVLAKWRFHPAQRQGRAISAYALVPIDFALP
ncbi:MAG: energy transducer TonB [Arenimonas sp.]|uniref:energy transducer TonB n=1 Tax=Arenimonas sp. TaxID=1872635 RepID=UPI0025BB9C0E|nr:energy transducer TonB [Arenimonas sp.]MBW8366553.1 energy transducer TonB [Arenimonas sp.]